MPLHDFILPKPHTNSTVFDFLVIFCSFYVYSLVPGVWHPVFSDRFCQIMPIWINNAASSSAHKSWKFRYDIILLQIRRVWTASDNHISVDKETFSFDCNMLNGGLPLRIVIGIRWNINSDSFLIKCHTGKWHIAFPTDHATNRSPWRFSNRKILFIRISPYNTLRAYRLQFSVHLIWPIRFKNNITVIKCSTNGISLRKTKADVCSCVP